MKKTFILLQASIIVLMLTFISQKASAQTAAPFSGPSDATTLPPTLPLPATVGKVICSGGTISLTAVGTIGNTYAWYKTPLNTGTPGTAVLVKAAGPVNVTSYTEAATAAGYYTYYVEQTNSTGCSTMSNPITVFVLPAIIPAITGPAAVCANGQTTGTLAVTPASLPAGYTYTYQWTRNTIDITTNGTSASYLVSETTATAAGSPVNFAVKVGFALNTTCTTTTSNVVPVAVIALPTPPSITIN